MKKLFIVFTVLILLSLFVSGMASRPESLAPSASIVVDTTLDSNAAGYQACTSASNDCSLRGAIILSNSTIDVVDTIIVPTGTYTLSETVSTGTDQSYGDLDISTPAIVVGAGMDKTTIRAGNNDYTGIDRVMEISNTTGTVKLSDLTIMWGRVISWPGGAGIYQSAATSTVVLERVAVNENNVLGDTTTHGGGILAAGDLTISDATIMFNNTNGYGGGIYASLNSYFNHRPVHHHI